MEYSIQDALPSFIMAVVMILIAAMLYNACRKFLVSNHDNRKLQKTEKIPEEHDERFSTGKLLMILHLISNDVITRLYLFTRSQSGVHLAVPSFGISIIFLYLAGF